MKRLLTLSLGLILLGAQIILTTPTSAQKALDRIVKSGELRVGMTLDQPPFSMKSKSGSPIGFDVELAEILSQSLDLKLKIVELPFHELLPGLTNGSIDLVISGMTITPQRNINASFVGPYMISGKSIITKSRNLALADESEDINQKELKIVALKGTTSEKFSKTYLDMANLILVEKYEAGIDLLLKDQADLMIADYPTCVLAQIKYPDAGFVTLNEPLTIEPIGIALPPNTPQLTNLLENYLKSLEIAGALAEMEDFWFNNPGWLQEVEVIKIKY